MNNPATTNILNIPQSDYLACIDGSKVEFIFPFREFLTAYGIAVEVNTIPDTSCLYHIVIGTSKEVKDIFSRVQRAASRRLIFLLDDSLEEAHHLSLLFNARVAVIGNRSIEQAETRVVFGFLCNGSDSVMDLRREEKKITNHQNSSEEEKKNIAHHSHIKQTSYQNLTEDYWEKDELRIAETMAQVYAPQKKGKKKIRSFQQAARVLLMTCFLFFFLHVFSVFFSLLLFAGSFIYKNHPQQVLPILSLAQTSLGYTTLSLQPIITVFPIPQIRMYERTISIVEQSEEVFADVIQLQNSVDPSMIFSYQPNNKKTPYADIAAVRIKGERIKNKLSLLLADINIIETSLPPSFHVIKNRLLTVEQKLTRAKASLDTMLKLSTVYPLVTPPSESRTFLLLFQNSEELRPTGGFIGSVGKAVITNGIIDQVTIEDVYTYDGQLRGHVDPPLPIRTLLQQEHWYLRDSNWDPDFEESARRAAWFYEKSGGEKVDGVIAVSLPFIQNLLEVTGPIRIAESSEAISKDTIFPLIHKQIEENFFPGSTQKKDLLGSISRRLLEEISQKNLDTLKLSSAVTDALLQKNIQIFSFDETLQQTLRAYQWGGQFIPADTCDSMCTADYIFPIEANLGINKANAGVQRNVEKQLTILNNSIKSRDTTTFTNSSEANEAGGGEYTSYTRFYYPEATDIHSIKVNGIEIEVSSPSMSPRARPYADLTTDKPGFLTLGVAFDVKSHNKTVIEIEQEQPFTGKEYRFYFRHQAGTASVPLKITATLPENSIPKIVIPDLKKEANTVFIAVSNNFEYTTVTDQDSSLVVSF